MISTILFDLDGTLLSMDQDYFTKVYFGLMAKKMAAYGYVPEELVALIWKGTKAMMQNDGSCTNETLFWSVFDQMYPGKKEKDYHLFDEFYDKEFKLAKETCTLVPEANKIVQLCKSLGFRIALATNPVFPRKATQTRIEWAGLNIEDFELVTAYEDSKTSKPNPQYFLDVCEKMGVKPEECLMIGNDADEDGACLKIGMSLFLVTNDLLNRSERDITNIPHGNFEDLKEFILNMQK